MWRLFLASKCWYLLRPLFYRFPFYSFLHFTDEPYTVLYCIVFCATLCDSDQVLLYIPVDGHVSKKDIAAKIEVKRVSIKIKDMDAIEFDCPERIIPDGSFWTFEEDDDQKYIQLDMEKRFRMINWKGLFSQHDDLPPISNEQNSMLDQLYAANKGISELTGASPESIEDMMGNPDLYSMMNGDINTSPTIVDDDGTQLGMGSSEAEEDLERAFRETIEETVSRDDIGDDDEDAGDGGNDFIDVEEVK